MKLKIYSILLIPFLAIASMCFLIHPGAAASLNNGAQYEWQEAQYSVFKTTIWDNEIQVQNYSGKSWGQTTSINYIYDTPDTYIVQTVEGFHRENYSIYQEATFSGNQTVSVNLNVFRVDASYGDGLQLIWMATKDGNLEIETWYTDYEYFYNISGKEHWTWTTTERRYNRTTDEFISEATSYSEEYKEFNRTSDEESPGLDYSEIDYYSHIEANFSAPLILTVQIYTTPNGEKVAWADMFYDYVFFNDTNHDGVYSPDLNSTATTSLSINNLNADEFCGTFMPIVAESYTRYDIVNETDPSKNYTSIQEYKNPAIGDFSSSIEFDAPLPSENNEISWSVTYPDYPIYGFYFNRSSMYPFEMFQHTQGDWSYGFDYKICEQEAEMDYTVDLPKFDGSDYDKVQGLGLAIPHYSYFMSSAEIDEQTDNDLFVPTDLFDFGMDGSQVAQIDMMDPDKMEYTLHDYPVMGTDSQFEAKGATVSELVVKSMENSDKTRLMTVLPCLDILFTTDHFINDNPAFSDFDKLFSIETQNYNMWSGERLTHDPTLRIFYTTSIENPEDSISGFAFVPLIGVAVISILVVMKRFHQKQY